MENAILDQNLTYLGEKFEIKFLNQIIGKRLKKGSENYRDSEYGISILPIVQKKHFSLDYSKVIFGIIQKYYAEYRSIPFYDTIRELIAVQHTNERPVYYQFLSDIENVLIENVEHIKNSATKFIQQQNFEETYVKAMKDIRSGKIKSYSNVVESLRKSIEVNDINQKPTEIREDNFVVMDDEGRNPIPTGCGQAFDYALNGGLSRGDLGVLGAGAGVGKTTFCAVQCAAAFDAGKTVVYIYFEGKESEFKSKFQAYWTGLNINDSRKKRNHKIVEDQCKRAIKKAYDKGGRLLIKKFDSVNTKWSEIEAYLYYIERILNYKIDELIIDYLECVNSDKDFGDNWHFAAPAILRSIENLIQEDKLNCAAWVLMQGKKETNGVKNITMDMLGGSAKIQQIAHWLGTVGKDFEQQKNGLANVNILKSRIGDIGRFENVIYDNVKVKILIQDENIVTNYEKPKKKEKEEVDY